MCIWVNKIASKKETNWFCWEIIGDCGLVHEYIQVEWMCNIAKKMRIKIEFSNFYLRTWVNGERDMKNKFP